MFTFACRCLFDDPRKAEDLNCPSLSSGSVQVPGWMHPFSQRDCDAQKTIFDYRANSRGWLSPAREYEMVRRFHSLSRIIF